MSNYNIVIGVDLGLTGGLAYFDSVSKELLSIYPMPTKKVLNKSGKEKSVLDLDKLHFILEIPKEHNDSAVVVFEDVHSFGNGGFSMDVIMEQKGILRGLAKGLGYGELLVSPKEWQKFVGIVCPKDIKDKIKRKNYLKDNSRQVAKILYPDWGHKFELKGSHGLSDATLIGHWYLENH